MLPRIPRQICSLRDKSSIPSAISSCIEIGGLVGAPWSSPLFVGGFVFSVLLQGNTQQKYDGLEIASVSKGKIRVFIVAGKLNTPKHTGKKTLENISDRTGLSVGKYVD